MTGAGTVVHRSGGRRHRRADAAAACRTVAARPYDDDMQTLTPAIRVSDEVRAAIDAGAPVLALESTILSHGLPAPRNLAVGLAAEQQVRDAGVVPATIGVVDGIAVVGLSPAAIERLCTSGDVVKVSVRDLPIARAKALDGGTTVAATAWLAHRAGIRVMSTGGLGGVHRGA